MSKGLQIGFIARSISTTSGCPEIDFFFEFFLLSECFLNMLFSTMSYSCRRNINAQVSAHI